MTDATRHPAPRTRAVFVELLRLTGLSVRREAAVAGMLLVALLAIMWWRAGPTNFTRDLGFWFASIGFATPILLWRRLAGNGEPWTHPVEHRRLLLATLAAGWCWLVAAVSVAVVWKVATILVTGGSFAVEVPRTLLPPGTDVTGPFDPRAITTVAWRTPAWLWVLPYSASTVAYLLGSALVVGTRHRWWWATAVVALVAGLGVALGGAPALAALIGHPFGPETVFAGGAVLHNTADVPLTTGGTLHVWRSLPDARRWMTATLLWTAIGAAAVWAATIRYRERERGD